ncbi:447_t:CDS:1, partial [Acaulospora colombiana]
KCLRGKCEISIMVSSYPLILKNNERTASVYSQGTSIISYNTYTSKSSSKSNRKHRRGDTAKFILIEKRSDQTPEQNSPRDTSSTVSSETESVVQKRRDEEYQSIGDTSKRGGINFSPLESVRSDLKDVVNVNKRGGVDFTPVIDDQEKQGERAEGGEHDSSDGSANGNGSILNDVIVTYGDYWDEDERATVLGNIGGDYSEDSSASHLQTDPKSRAAAQYTLSSAMVTTPHFPSTPSSPALVLTPVVDRKFVQSHSSISQYSQKSYLSSSTQRSRLLTLPSSPRDGFTPTFSSINLSKSVKPERTKGSNDYTVVAPRYQITQDDNDDSNTDTASVKTKSSKKLSNTMSFKQVNLFSNIKSSSGNNNNSHDNYDVWG